MKNVICPNCYNTAEKGGYGWVHWIIMIFLFPIGLIALAFPKQNRCFRCGFTWR